MAPEETFDYAIKIVLENEGGYVWDKNDPGGETNFGISKRAYPTLDIAALTWEDAKVIYRRDYWERIGGDLLPPALAVVALDSAINHGVSRVLGWLGEQPHSYVTLSARRLEYYTELSTWERYSKGWSRRVARVLRAAQKLEPQEVV